MSERKKILQSLINTSTTMQPSHLNPSSKVSHLPRIARTSSRSQNRLDALSKEWQSDDTTLTKIREGLEEVATRIVPVWPLNDFVAVNPWAGMANHSFLDARQELQSYCKVDLLMPLEYYRQAWELGGFSTEDLQTALAQCTQTTSSGETKARWSIEEILAFLASPIPQQQRQELESPVEPRLQTVSAWIDGCEGTKREPKRGTMWHPLIINEVGKICAAHYDLGQSRWTSPWKHLSLYHAWLRMSQLDRRMEIEGLYGFRKFVAKLPEDAEQALAMLVHAVQIPEHSIEKFLLTHAYAMPGWCAWVLQKQRSSITDPEANASESDLAGLLAIRMAHEIALIRNDEHFLEGYSTNFLRNARDRTHTKATDEAAIRLLLLRAAEIAETRKLLKTIATGIKPHSPSVDHAKSPRQEYPQTTCPNHEQHRPNTQMIFCIDVRSERIRKHLEAIDGTVETYGFAGFFGLPFEYIPIEHSVGSKQVPPLLNPKFRIFEGTPEEPMQAASKLVQNRIDSRLLAHHFQRLKESSVACFAFVEALGLAFTWLLLKRTFRWKANKKTTSPGCCPKTTTGPTLKGLNQQGLTTTQQIDLAEGMLRGIGLIHTFAPTVVFCGHQSQTENNPLQAGLDCGACGGHSGLVNAQVAALLLNQGYVRQGLAERGITIPSDTVFLAAVHNTTTDAITIQTAPTLSASHEKAIENLRLNCLQATRCSQAERLVTLDDADRRELIRRSRDWSEIRPEWGLAGNFAFLAAPRQWTKNVSLGGKSFLHSYDSSQDSKGQILEQIMTAPMIVAHWINMQYYASTVSPEIYGSGSKTLHNVVGRFGILSGNAGDLRTGLPWQSLASQRDVHHQPYHSPLRLSVFLAAGRERIDSIVSKHSMISLMIENQWLHLYSIEDGECWHAVPKVGWQPVLGFSQ